jgi:hypothetical protein
MMSRLSITAAISVGILTSACASARQWTPTGSMSTERAGHAAVTLPSGSVLAAGGFNMGVRHLTATDVYNPTRRTWTTAAALPRPQREHGILVSTGEALYAGGDRDDLFHASGPTAYLFREGAGTWSPTANPPAAQPGGHAGSRNGAQLVELLSGRVLFVGGYNGHGGDPAFATAEIYDPTTRSWSSAGSMGRGRLLFAAARLPSGKVIATGGVAGSGERFTVFNTTEIYDPSTDTWSPGPPMSSPRFGHVAIALPSGGILVTGGFSSAVNRPFALNSAEIYDPGTNSWQRTAFMANARGLHGAALLSDGKVLVAGGQVNNFDIATVVASAEVYDPVRGTWSSGGDMASPRTRFTLTPLSGGRALAAGGRTQGGAVLASAEIFAPPSIGTVRR